MPSVSMRVLSVLFVLACVSTAVLDVVLFGPMSTEGDHEWFADWWLCTQAGIPFAYGFATACCSLRDRDWAESPILDVPVHARARSGLSLRVRTLTYVGCLAAGLLLPLALCDTYDHSYALLAAGSLPVVHLMCGSLGFIAAVLVVHPVAAAVAMARWRPVRQADRTTRTDVVLQAGLVWCIAPCVAAVVVGRTPDHEGSVLTAVGLGLLGVMVLLGSAMLALRGRSGDRG